MPWYSPPSRRELSLILFSISIFVLFYNLEGSFQHLTTTSSPLDGSLSFQGPGEYFDVGATRHWRAAWDREIYGDWAWEERQVVKNAQKKRAKDDKAMRSGKGVALAPDTARIHGTVGANDGYVVWGDDLPKTALVQHVPGHAIIDNVFMLNGTVFVVTDDNFPSLGTIASSAENSHEAPRASDWQLLSSDQARETLGRYGGLIHGVTWLSTDTSPSNYTLFSLWRTYSSLNTSISMADTLTLPPPRRIVYPYIPTFMGERPDLNGPIVLRQRSPSGYHPHLPKAAFPTMGFMYQEDWEDYSLMHVPFLLRRVVVADQGAARRSRGDVPPFALPFVQLEASKEWWEPIRQNVVGFLNVDQETKKSWIGKTKMVITYLSRQDATDGPKLKGSDHETLVKALNKMGSNYIVHIVPSEAPWRQRLSALVQSTVVIGVYGDHLADSIFMMPSAQSTLMEIFPPGTFARDAEISVNSIGINYFAWWKDQQHGRNSLPPVIPPKESQTSEIPLDAAALIKAIRRIA